MKIIILFSLLLFPITCFAQKVIGTYHSILYNQDFNVELDCKEAKFKGKDVEKKSYENQIYLQVYTEDIGKKAYIQLSKGKAKSFENDMKKELAKAQKWAINAKKPRKGEGDGEVTLFFTSINKGLGTEIMCRETGQDYNKYFVKENDKVRVYYEGESASNEGKENVKLSGWGLAISSEEEISQIATFLNQAVSILKEE